MAVRLITFIVIAILSSYAAAQNTTYGNGAYIIDMGQAIQTEENALKPYGLVYDLTTNHKIPVDWVIKPGKSFAFENAGNAIDFSYGGKDYYAGPLIISAEFAAAAKPVIDAWVAKGVVVDQATAGDFSADVFGTITSFPRVLLDSANGSIAAQAFFEPAEIPTTAYALGEPLELTDCNDIYILPHADPQSWDDATKTVFSDFVTDGGYLWSACHAVSSMEADSALGFLGLEMLTSAGMADFGDIDNSNTKSYNYDTDSADDPIMQIFAALSDGDKSALSGGSQEINVLDTDSSWRPSTVVAVSDPTNPNVLAGGGSYPAPAALLSYGPTFGTGPGFVVYETSHSIQGGTDEQNVSAARIIGNFLLQASIGKAPILENFTLDAQPAGLAVRSSITIEALTTVPLSIDVRPSVGVASDTYTYQWTSSCGGTFDVPTGTVTGNPANIATNWTAPAQTGGCIIRIVVEDDCGRTTFDATALTIVQPSGLDLNKSVDKSVASPDDLISYTLEPDYTSAIPMTDLCVAETLPANTSFISATPPFNTGPNCVASGNWYLGSNTPGVPGIVAPVYTQQTYTFDNTVPVDNVVVDTYITSKDAGKNFGTDNTLKSAFKDGGQFNSLMKFDLAGIDVVALPIGWQVNSATMNVEVTKEQDDSGASVYALLTDWVETGATWQTPTGTGTWSTGDFTASDYNGSVLGLLDTTSTGVKSVDLTTTVEGWLKGVNSNYGVTLVGTLSDKEVEYGSREDGSGPALTVVLDIPNSPSSEVSIVAGPSLVGDGDVLTVVMSIQALLNPSAITVSVPALTSVTTGGASVSCGPPSVSSVNIGAGGGAALVTYSCTAAAGTALTQGVVFESPSFNADDLSVGFAAATSNGVIVAPDLGFTIKVNPGIAIPNQVINTGTIADSGAFTVPVDSNEVITNIVNSVDLAIDKTVDNTNPTLGGTVIFTLAVSNNGPGNATGVVVTDTLPVGYTYVSNDSGAVWDGSTLTWAVGDMLAGASASLTVTVVVFDDGVGDISDGKYVNSATVTGNESDSDLSNNTDSAHVIPGFPAVLAADVGIVKSVDNAAPIISVENVTFTLTATNQGPDPALNVEVSDTLPAGYGVISTSTVTGSASNAGNAVTWTIGTLASGASATVAIVASVNDTGPYENTATITTTTTDPNTGNNIDTEITTPTREADLEIVKTVDEPAPDVGSDVTFSLTVTNNGPNDATNAIVVDSLPDGYTYVSNDQGATWDDVTSTLTWVVGDLANGDSATMSVVVTVTDTGNYLNTATVDGTETDPDEGNNIGTITTTPSTTVDLSIIKTVDNASPTVGDTVNFTLSINNAGPSDESAAVVTDVIPTGYTYLSNDRGATYDAPSRTLTWAVGPMAAGQSDSMIVSVEVAATGDYLNEAVIDGNETDSNTGNNSSTDQVTANQSADLGVVKLVDTPRPSTGDTVVFTIIASNNGPSDATGVTVTDALPAGYSEVSSSASKGSYTTPTWDIGALANGESATLTITTTLNDVPIDSGGYANTAEITGTQPDPDPGNNIDTEVTSPEKSADIAIVKTVDNTTPVVGETVTFTLEVTNQGPDTAAGVVATDVLPNGYTLVSATPQGATSFTDPDWDIGTLYAGQIEQLIIVATVESSGDYDNVATVTSTGPADPDLSNNTDSAITTPTTLADLSVTKVVDNRMPLVGDQVVFTITAANNGPNDGTNVTVSDPLPAGYSYVSDVASLGLYDDLSGIWDIGSLPSGTVETLAITATVVDVPVSANAYLNVATIDGTEIDPDEGNNTDSEWTIPLGLFAADVAVVKTVDNPTPIVGSQVTFTMTATNNGPDLAINVQGTDIIPSGYTYVSSVPSGLTLYDPGTGNWLIGNMAVSAVESLQIVVTVNSDGDYTNAVSVTSTFPPDPDTTNNTDTAVTTPMTLADMAVTKTVDNATPNVGDDVTFTIAVTNNGPNDATAVVVTDYLPVGYLLVTTTPSVGSVVGNTWLVGDMSNGVTETLQLVVTVLDVPSATVDDFNNRVSVDANEDDPDSSNNTDNAFTNPSGLITADVAITKVVDEAAPVVGSDVSFTLTASNNGPDPASNVSVMETLPSGYTFVSAAPSGATTFAGNTWSIGTLNVSQVESLIIVATVNATGDYNNITTITATEPDPDPGNNTDNAITTPRLEADLEVLKEVDNTTPAVGTDVVFSVIVTNNGPNDATGVSVTDLLPQGYTYVTSLASQGAYNEVTGIWDVGALADGENATLQIQATVVDVPVGVGAYLNTATVGGNETDPDLGNNTDSSFTVPLGLFAADVAIQKEVDNSTPVVGEKVIFTLTATNNGPDAATGVSVSDPAPAGYTFVGARPSGTTSYDQATSVWSIGTLTVGQVETLEIEATVTYTASYDNVATITSVFPPDPDTSNNVDNAITTPMVLADMSILKTVDTATPAVNSDVNFTITAINNGPNNATSVVVTDVLPPGYVYVSSTASKGTVNASSWQIGDMANGDIETLQVTATVIDANGTASDYNNVADISATETDPDTGNNTDNAFTNPTGLIVSDLAIDKVVDEPSPIFGADVTFTLTATNLGPDPATNVVVADAVPAGYAVVSSTASAGTYVGSTWTIGSMLVGTSETLDIVATVQPGGNYQNSASITGTEPDPNTGNNTDTAVTTPRTEADLSVSKTGNPAPPARPSFGDTITFDIVVVNNGPSDATGVVVSDVLPLGYVYVSSTATRGSFDGGTGLWAVGNVANGASETLTITAQVVYQHGNLDVNYVNQSQVSGNETDPDTSNNTDTGFVVPNQLFAADIEVQKLVDNPTPLVGDSVTFTVSVGNNGPDRALGVTVSDLLPSGYILDSVGTPSKGTVAGTTWTIGNMTVNDTETLSLTAFVQPSGDYTNVVTVDSLNFPVDPDDTNDTDDAITDPLALIDLVMGKTVDDPSPDIGTNVTFTLTVTNNGPSLATGVTVTDSLPSGYELVSASPSMGTLVGDQWNVGMLATGATATLDLVVTVLASGDYLNTATVSGNETDSNIDNNTDTETISPITEVDLSVVKTVDNATPTVGDTVTFSVLVANAGPSPESNAVIMDVIPTGYTYLSNNRGATYDAPSSTLTWDIGLLGADASDTMQVMVTVNPTGNYSNTATIDGTGIDTDLGNNSSIEVTTPLQSADLAVTKLVDTPRPATGDTVVFTVTATNNGPSNATNVAVADAVPAGYTVQSTNPSLGSYAAPNWTIGAMSVGQTETLEITAIVEDVPVDSDGYANTADIDGTEPDPDTSNNTDTAITSPDKSADIAITKEVDEAAPVVGTDVTFTVTVTNNGPDIASDVTVNDALPDGYTLVSAIPQGPTTWADPTWTIGTMYPGDSENLLIVATIQPSGDYDNVATVTSSGPADPDSSNNTDNAITTPVTLADLAVTKLADVQFPSVGSTVNFTVTARNNGPNTATNVQVVDALPPGYLYVSDTPSQGTYDDATGIWDVGSLTNGQVATLTLTAQVVDVPIGGNSYLNVADIGGTETDPDEGNNTDSVWTIPLGLFAADVSIGKVVDNPTPIVGTTVTFTMTATNNGPDPAINVTATDMLPSGYTFVSAVPSGATTFNSGTGIWALGNMLVAQVESLQIVATVNASGDYNNVINIDSLAPPDPDVSNNSDSAETVPQTVTDLAVTKTVDNQNPAVGDNVTFTVAASNNGPNDATGVTVTDFLPVGYTLVSATPSTGTVIGNAWTIGDLANGVTETLQLVVTVVDVPAATTDDYTNRVLIEGNETDPDDSNNTDSAFTDPSGLITADVVLAKVVGDPSPLVGANVTFTLTAGNNGPDPATSVTVTDTLPSGYTFVSAAPSGATSFAGNTWTIGTLAVGQMESLLITATVQISGDYNNIGSITATEPDPDPGNNTDNALVTPRTEADLSITKTVDNQTPLVGDDVIHSIVVVNNGPNDANGVTVIDVLPIGYTYVDSLPSQGTYDNITGLWDVGTVLNGNAATLDVQATVKDAAVGLGSYVNTATVDGNETDPDEGNNTDLDFVVPLGLFAADVQITKSVNNPTPVVGENVLFTLVASNNGPDASTGVSVSDPLPAGYSYVSATPSGVTTYDAATSTWTIGTLTVGQEQTLVIEATVTYIASYDNVATISSVFPTDPVPGNNTDSAITTPQVLADIAIDKSVDIAEPAVNTDVVFTLAVTNNGPNNATNVTVSDVVPAGYVYVSSTVTKGTVNASSWVIGDMTDGEVATATVTATVVDVDGDVTNYTNIANVTATETDPDTSNNVDDALTNPSGLIVSDMAVTKSVDVADPLVGSDIIFTVVATNYGPDPATGVVVNDAVPAGYSVVSSTASKGSYIGNVWTIGGMLLGASESLDIVATVQPGGNYDNGAQVSAIEPDPNPDNNVDNAITTPRTEADLQVTKVVDMQRPVVGSNVNFTVTALNNGPNTATNVGVVDPLPAGYSYVSNSATQGTYNAATGIWSIGTLTSGASASLTITAQVVDVPIGGNNYVNVSDISGNETDPDPGNNTDNVWTLPSGLFAADVAITKAVDNATPVVGSDVTFTLTATNLGPDPSLDVIATEVLPSGYTFVSAAPSGATTFDSGTGTWTIGNLTVGQVETLQVVATVNPDGSYLNVANITSTGPVDQNTTNNSDSAETVPQTLANLANLAVSKTVNNLEPLAGEDVTFTIVVTNNGPSDATGVAVTDSLPSGYSLVSYSVSIGTVVGDTWTIGNLANGASATLEVVATVLSSGNYVNTATVDGSEPDPDGGNNIDTATTHPPTRAIPTLPQWMLGLLVLLLLVVAFASARSGTSRKTAASKAGWQ